MCCKWEYSFVLMDFCIHSKQDLEAQILHSSYEDSCACTDDTGTDTAAEGKKVELESPKIPWD